MPTKTATATRGKGQFLWINKDPSSSKLSNSRDSRDLLYAIHSHVRPKVGSKRKSTYAPSPRKAKRVASDSCRSVASEVRDSPTSISDLSSNLSTEESEDIEEVHGLPTPQEITGYQSYPPLDPSLQDIHEIEEIQEIERQEPQICNAIAQSAMDPFDCSGCQFDQDTYSVMQYHLNFSRFYLFRNEAVIHNWAYKKHLSHNFIQNMFLNSIQHPMHFHALAAATAARMSTLIPNNKSVNAVASKSMQHAVRDLRSYFANVTPGSPVDTRVVTDVFLLCMAAWFRGDLKTARVHLQPLQQLTSDLLCDDSNIILLDMVATIDLWVASELSTRPLLPQFWHPERPSKEKFSEISARLSQSSKKPRAQEVFNVDVVLTPEEKLKSSVGHLNHLRRLPNAEESFYLGPGLTGIEQKAAIGFAEAVLSGILNPHMTRVMQSYLPYCALHTHIWLDGHPTPPQIHWVNRSCKTLIYQMLLATPPAPDASITDWLSEIARLTLLMHLNYGPNPMAWRMQQASAPFIQRAILSYENACFLHRPPSPHPRTNTTMPRPQQEQWLPTPLLETRLILWATLSGAYASHEQPELFEWFISRGTQIAKSLGIRNYLQLHLSMGHFGHCDTLHLAAISSVLQRLREERAREVEQREAVMEEWLKQREAMGEMGWAVGAGAAGGGNWGEVEDDMRAYLI
jgi:hypothetical protein